MEVICPKSYIFMACRDCEHAGLHEQKPCRVGWDRPYCDELTHVCPATNNPIKCREPVELIHY